MKATDDMDDYVPTYEELLVVLHNQLSARNLPIPGQPGLSEATKFRLVRRYCLRFAKEMSK